MKNKKKTFLVLGYLDTGSGTLTFPEDFDFIGSYTDQEEAQKHVDLLNKREGHGDDGDDELVEDFEGRGWYTPSGPSIHCRSVRRTSETTRRKGILTVRSKGDHPSTF